MSCANGSTPCSHCFNTIEVCIPFMSGPLWGILGEGPSTWPFRGLRCVHLRGLSPSMSSELSPLSQCVGEGSLAHSLLNHLARKCHFTLSFHWQEIAPPHPGRPGVWSLAGQLLRSANPRHLCGQLAASAACRRTCVCVCVWGVQS